jgi:hypothetical protein
MAGNEHTTPRRCRRPLAVGLEARVYSLPARRERRHGGATAAAIRPSAIA